MPNCPKRVPTHHQTARVLPISEHTRHRNATPVSPPLLSRSPFSPRGPPGTHTRHSARRPAAQIKPVRCALRRFHIAGLLEPHTSLSSDCQILPTKASVRSKVSTAAGGRPAPGLVLGTPRRAQVSAGLLHRTSFRASLFFRGTQYGTPGTSAPPTRSG